MYVISECHWVLPGVKIKWWQTDPDSSHLERFVLTLFVELGKVVKPSHYDGYIICILQTRKWGQVRLSNLTKEMQLIGGKARM